MINPWQILGLESDASSEEIKKAFRALAQEHHPDHGGDPKIFVALNRAFGLIRTEEKKERFKREGERTTVTLRAKALEYLCSLLLTKVRSAHDLSELRYQHLTKIIGTELNKKLAVLRKDYKALKIGLKDLEEIADRIECKEKENILQNALKGETESIFQTLGAMRKEMQILYKAKKLLKPYSYRAQLRKKGPEMDCVRIGSAPKIFFDATPF